MTTSANKTSKKTVAGSKKRAPKRAVVTAVPRQRATTPRRPRPMVVSARRSDGRGTSYAERLGAAMHKRLGHTGPVCHPCRLNASQLAAAAQAPSPIAI